MGAQLDYDSEYETHRQSPAILELFAGWSTRSQDYRATRASCELDVRYGDGARHTYDYFPVEDPAAPLVVYIHGGYWQGGDRKSYSFLAEAFNQRGYSVAMPSYSLCPDVGIADITGELLGFLQHFKGRVNKRAVLIGHSAGAHLAATILAASDDRADPSWRPIVAVGVSGVYDLLPLIPTTLNAKLRLTPAEALACSPSVVTLPPGAALYRAVGGYESAEFHRQSRDAAPRDAASPGGKYLVIDNRNHYTILGDFVLSSSGLSQMLERALAHSK